MNYTPALSRALPLLAACLALAGPATAQQKAEPGKRPPTDGQRPPGDGQRPPQDGSRGRDMFANLNLTDEQRNAVREAFQANGERMRELGEKMMAARKSLQDAMWAEKLDPDLIRKKAEELGKLEGESSVLRAQAFAKIRPLLSAEQIERLKSTPPFGQGRSPGAPDAQPGGTRRPGGDAPGEAPKRGGERKPEAPPK